MLVIVTEDVSHTCSWYVDVQINDILTSSEQAPTVWSLLLFKVLFLTACLFNGKAMYVMGAREFRSLGLVLMSSFAAHHLTESRRRKIATPTIQTGEYQTQALAILAANRRMSRLLPKDYLDVTDLERLGISPPSPPRCSVTL